MKSNKQMLKEAAGGLTKTFIILFAVIVFKLSFILTAALILTVTAVLSVIQAKRSGWPAQWWYSIMVSLATTLLVIYIIHSVYQLLGDYSVIALLVVVLIISGLILWNKRQEYLEVIRHVERRVWGATMEERRAVKKQKAMELKPYE